MRSPLVALLLALALPAHAQGAKGSGEAAAREPLRIPYEKYTLPNGLEVILHQDRKLPVVAVNLWYHVGAFHETPGRSGFAHLFEHVMFQGSEHVGDDVHISKLEQLGATDLNGTTNFDRTNYFQTVPSHHLETALWLESDRMGFLLDALTPDKLERQQQVVKNERRQGYEAAPYGLAREKLWQALFPEPHPYHGSVIGSMVDLDAATLDDVKGFFRTWYAPSNATLAIVGDFEPARAKALVEKYFGPLPSAPEPKAPEVAPARLERAVELRHEERVGSLPMLVVAWHSPALYAEGDATADVLATLLSDGKHSRLYRRLVHEKQLATSVSAAQQSMGAQSVFLLNAVARPGVTTDTLLKELDAALAEVRQKGVGQDEIQRARNQYDTRVLSGLQSVGGFGGKADVLQGYNHFKGEPDWLAQDLERYARVTPGQVQAFARDTLDPARRVVLHAVPPAAASRPSASQEKR